MGIHIKINRIVVILVICAVIAAVPAGCGSGFDASGYVLGILDVVFQDEPSQALRTMDGVTPEELHKMHGESIQVFVEENITNEVGMSDSKTSEFYSLCEKIFSVMKYHVGKADKTGKLEYEVSVEIKPSDVFIRFREALKKDSEKIAAKVQAGGYEGTDDEISVRVLNDIVNHAYELLDVSYTDMEFGEAETVVLNVRANEKKEYSVDEEDMEYLLVKILRLDEIQD